MSDPTPTPPSTEAIVQQIQTADSIEADLADAVIAVAGSSPDHASAVVLDQASEMEQVLEDSIPALPDASQQDPQPIAQLQSTEETSLEPTFPSLEPSSAPPTSNAIDASETSETHVVHDIEAETAREEETSPMVVEMEEPTESNMVEATMNPEDNAASASAAAAPPLPAHLLPENDASSVIPSNPGTPTPSTLPTIAGLPPRPQTDLQQSPSGHPQAPLPEGLTDSSPSVAQNPDLIRSWKHGMRFSEVAGTRIDETVDPSSPALMLALFSSAVTKTEIVDARAWYNAIAVENPTATQPLLALINLELSLSNFPQVEELFAKALKGSLGGVKAAADVNIWKAYLHYIRRQNPVTEGSPNIEQARATVAQAYEFALKECGNDKESGDIWQEYITYLSEATSKNTWETQQQQDNLRKVYQRAVCIPLNNVESLWKAYDSFESGLNKLTAKKFLAERSPAYMTARTALRELRSLTDSLPHPVLPAHPSFTDSDRMLVAAWKAYLKWEEGNPLVIEDEELLRARIGYAMRKCLGEMRHYPELWFYVYAATYKNQSGNADEALAYLKAGVEVCPKSFLLSFAYAEMEEDRKNYAVCHATFESLISRLAPEIDELKVQVAADVAVAKGPEINALPDGDEMAVTRLQEERENRGKKVADTLGIGVDEAMAGLSLVWIMYMRFARRAEGIKAARLVFGKARKSPHTTWQCYEASAMMEYHTNKDSAVAIRIFEFGLKLFAENVAYVIKYLRFLLHINDDTNARALFERSALKIPADKARPLWDAWARYEYMYGDLAAVHKLETRFTEMFPNDSALKRFAQRFTYSDIDQIAFRDLGFGSRPLPQAPIPVAAAPAPSPAPKRPASPTPISREFERSRSPAPYKRHRAASPIPPPRRYPPPAAQAPEREWRYNPPPVRERSPPPPPRREAPPIHPRDQYERSGVTKPLSWFIGTLPTSRAFDGPLFRPDDIMDLFSSISTLGQGLPPPLPPSRNAYPEPPSHYRGPPPPQRARQW
ncbi:cleavage stimulation factor subunit 3, partial [Tremellales sp. Uapishka_1]